MPLGAPDPPADPPADPGAGGGGGGGTVFGGGVGGFGPGSGGAFGGLTGVGGPFRRQQVIRGLRGFGENIPLVSRSRGLYEQAPQQGGGMQQAGGGGMGATGAFPSPGGGGWTPPGNDWIPDNGRLIRPGGGGGRSAPPGGGAPPAPPNNGNDGGGLPLGDPNMAPPVGVNPVTGIGGGNNGGVPGWNGGNIGNTLDIPRLGRPRPGYHPGSGTPRPPGGGGGPGPGGGGGDTGWGDGPGGPIIGGQHPGPMGGYTQGPVVPYTGPPITGGPGGVGIDPERISRTQGTGGGRNNRPGGGGGGGGQPPVGGGPPPGGGGPPPGGGGVGPQGGGGGFGGTGGGGIPWNPDSPTNDPNGEPIRYIRPTQTRGGGPGYGPGGGFTGFAGASPDAQGGGGMNQESGIYGGRRRVPNTFGFAEGGFVPGVSPGAPQPIDTVSAKLAPNEMVMNTGVTSNPTLAAILTLLNILGAQHVDSNGPDEGVPCPHCGEDMSGDMMDDGTGEKEPNGYACGGHVKGYAFGGFAKFGGGNKFFGGGGGAPKGGQRPLGGNQPANDGYTRNPEGGVTGGYNPSNPWGQLTGNTDTRTYGQGVRNLGGYGEAGYFDPRGNQMLINSQNEAAQGTADALVRRQVTQADLGGLDPAQRAVAKQQALRDTGRGVQDIMANTRANALGAQDAWAKNLYGTLLSGDLGFTGADQNAKLQDYLANQANERNKKGAWGDIAGGVLGSAAGGYLGGRGKKGGN